MACRCPRKAQVLPRMATVPTSSKPPLHPTRGLRLLPPLRLAVGWALLRGSLRTAVGSGQAPSPGCPGLQLSWDEDESTSP